MAAPKDDLGKFADYTEPAQQDEDERDSRTPAEIAYERAQQKRVSTIT